ncbi:hypothetical protein BH24ACT5_BH24ACT5_00080 [soil metagenome]
MELAFIVSAIRRYFWVVVLVTLVGAGPGLLVGADEPEYTSRGVLLILPPATFGGDQDRYVNGQLSVLRSDVLARRVLDTLADEDVALLDVSESVDFEREPQSDIVTVSVEGSDPELAQRIGDAYMDVYITVLSEQSIAVLEPLDEQIRDLRQQISETDDLLADAMRPYVDIEPVAVGEFYAPIPGVDQVAPSLVSQKSILLTQFNDIMATRAEVQVNSQFSASGRVVEGASLPTVPDARDQKLILAVGMLGGAFLGVLLAVLWARLSPRVLDDDHAAEILTHPMVGTLPQSKALRQRPLRALTNPPREVLPFVDSLCVRVESAARRSDSLSVVVVGTQRIAGTSTVAAAIASRFSATGARVLLVDADSRRPKLTALTSKASGDRAADTTSTQHVHQVRPSQRENLRLATIGQSSSGPSMRRNQVGDLLGEASSLAEVVVFDGGPLMDASTTIQLTRICDAVVLAMPTRQNARSLVPVADELRSRAVLPVWVPVKAVSRRSRSKTANQPSRRPTGKVGRPAAESSGVQDAAIVETVRGRKGRELETANAAKVADGPDSGADGTVLTEVGT